MKYRVLPGLLFFTLLIGSCNLPVARQAAAMQTATPAAGLSEITPTPGRMSASPLPVNVAPSPTTALIDANNAAQLKPTAETHLEGEPPANITWVGNGRYLAVSNNHHIWMFDPATLQSAGSVILENPNNLLDVSPDGYRFASSADQQTLQLRSVNDGHVLNTISPGQPFGGAEFSPDGSLLVINSMDSLKAELWDSASGKLKTTLTGFETAAPVYSVHYSPSGKTILWVSRATVQLSTIADGKMSPRFAHEDFVSGFALSPSDNLLATSAGTTIKGDFLSAIQLWDTASAQVIHTLIPGDVASQLIFSPDGSLLAASAAKTIQIWQVSSGEKITTLAEHKDTVTASAFSPDGSSLASISTDGTLIIWKIQP